MRNWIKVSGIVKSTPQYSHTIKNKSLYRGIVMSTRLSGNADYLQFICEEKYLEKLEAGSIVTIEGCIRTRNVKKDERTRLDVFIYVRGVTAIDRPDDLNHVDMEGNVCYASAIREVGARKISCIKIANNGLYNKTNYLPCVLWGHDAEIDFQMGDEIRIKGGMQSRDYLDSEGEKHTTYEVSVTSVKFII